MSYADRFDNSYEARLKRQMKVLRWQKVHLDPVLLSSLGILAAIGCLILYSASNENIALIRLQVIHFFFAFVGLIIIAQVPPSRLEQASPWLFSGTVILLTGVLLVGHVSQGARRWLGIGALQIQPSEIMKVAMPMMLAWFLNQRKLPVSIPDFIICLFIITVPCVLIIKQPDLGTAILIFCSGLFVVLFSGINWKYIASLIGAALASSPLLWHHLHEYQKQRILTMLSPENDPLGSGYNIIQSKIAVGSGGFLGKGYLHGTQSHLAFLPTHTTDFIFAVSAEEFGFIGSILLLMLFLCVFARCLYISQQSQSTYTRLLAGSLSCTFILNVLINMAMVIGILPVVGVPLPLISYGGSSILTAFVYFGIIMSIHTHRKLWSS